MEDEHERHIVPEAVTPCRFSDYAMDKFYGLPSRKSVKKAIKKGELKVDGEEANTALWISPGMVITYHPKVRERKVFEYRIQVVYEDQHMAVVNKPAGVPTSGNAFRTLENALPFNLWVSTIQPSFKYPKPVHRLDYGTSGLVIIAKTPQARILLGEMLEKREIQKEYHAVVRGQGMPDKGELFHSIEGKMAYSSWKIQGRSPNGRYTLIHLVPQTGRTHQLRIQCSAEGFPIVGDKQYSNAPDPGKGLLLCATGLKFKHPVLDQSIEIEIPIPNKFKRIMKR